VYVEGGGSGHVPLLRYIEPHYPILVGVWGCDDREKINMCLMYRYLISYEPLNFKGRLDDFPLTVEYGKKVDARGFLIRGPFGDRINITGIEAVAPDCSR
jgi:hypothetical protein